MTTTIPDKSNISLTKLSQNGILQQKSSYRPSFKGVFKGPNEQIMKVFANHYGSIGERMGEKLHKLTRENEPDILRKSSRFTIENGALSISSIKDKKVGRSLVENIVFPFITLPLYGASALLKQAQKIPFLKNTAESLYKKPIFRIPRKLNEMDSKTDMLKGMFEKTQQTIKNFAKEKNMEEAELLKILANPEKHADKAKLIQEANDNIKENLYKVGNKFFDKHTGNFNTAYERPLNRLITGAIPVAFLANDAYNLSVLCGDKKEDSEKEADERTKQEIIRICTTAYIQLLTFGAFTKQVNTIQWFAPVTSAATVFVSEIFSRHKIGKPVFFLSKDTAQEYNQKLASKNANNNQDTVLSNPQTDKKSTKAVNTTNLLNLEPETSVFKGFNKLSSPASIASFSSAGGKDKKKEQKKALMNFSTFKQGVIILTGTFFGLNFLKNSSLTKNSALITTVSDAGKYLKKNIYNRLAKKDFEITEETYNSVINSLKQAGGEKVAEGHDFIKGKYSAMAENGMIKLFKSSLNSSGRQKVIEKTLEQAKNLNNSLTGNEAKIIEEALKTAIKQSEADIAENNSAKAAKKAMEIIKNKKVNLNEEQIKKLTQTVTEEINNNAKKETIKIDTKIRPFVDIITEPFKFIYSAARLPFKFAKSGINLIVKPVEMKAAEAALGKAELSKFEQGVHRVITEIFGEEDVKTRKLSQDVFANAMEQLEKKTLPYRKAEKALQDAVKAGKSKAEIAKLTKAAEVEKQKLTDYINDSVGKSFNGITQSSNKNTDLALMSKLASSTVTSAFLVADNYNMVMIKTNGEDSEEAKEKANERIIQRLSGLFYQALFINWFNATFRSTYNSSLTGMASVAVPNTITTEVLMRSSIGMPIGRKTIDELNEMDRENENRTGFTGKYFEFMRLLTGKKPLKDRLPKEQQDNLNSNKKVNSTNVLEMLSKR